MNRSIILQIEKHLEGNYFHFHITLSSILLKMKLLFWIAHESEGRVQPVYWWLLWGPSWDQWGIPLDKVKPLNWRQDGIKGAPTQPAGASQVVLVVKNPPANADRCKKRGFSPWLRKIHWRRTGQPTPVFLPGESQGQRSLAVCSPWCSTESDMTEATYHAHNPIPCPILLKIALPRKTSKGSTF